jgi:hypothetical protein
MQTCLTNATNAYSETCLVSNSSRRSRLLLWKRFRLQSGWSHCPFAGDPDRGFCYASSVSPDWLRIGHDHLLLYWHNTFTWTLSLYAFHNWTINQPNTKKPVGVSLVMILVFMYVHLSLPITVAARSKAWCVLLLGHWDRGFESHFRHGCLCAFILFSCV